MPPGGKLIITDEFEGDIIIDPDEDEELPRPTSSIIVVPGEEYLHDDELKDMPDEVRKKIEDQVMDELTDTRFGKVGKAHTLGRGKRTQRLLLNEEKYHDRKEIRIKPLESGKESRKRKG